MKLDLGLVALAALFLTIAGATALLARGSPEAPYTPITFVVVVLFAVGGLVAAMLVYIAVKR